MELLEVAVSGDCAPLVDYKPGNGSDLNGHGAITIQFRILPRECIWNWGTGNAQGIVARKVSGSVGSEYPGIGCVSSTSRTMVGIGPSC